MYMRLFWGCGCPWAAETIYFPRTRDARTMRTPHPPPSPPTTHSQARTQALVNHGESAWVDARMLNV
ncbi:hypothetical protein EVAR_22613_1 [Eumeta japonica]|uniref:Uncharacterized protein n=1 Tax=Eumeta variegata TaxID=151549 RepID=A0A4C1U891_EUMVA|nr:hypothetical protein EVAR_22613_1 [Eumeta japonica]